MLIRILVLALVVAGCHHDEPAPVTPLPPSTGTPIGFLIDSAKDLKLTPDQLSNLRGIDENLTIRLKAIDHDSKPKKQGSGSGSGSSAPRASMSGGGMGGGMGGMGGGRGGRRRRGTTSGSAAPGDRPSGAAMGADAERVGAVRDAITAALAALDPGQQTTAKKIFYDHDVDYDVGSTDEEQIEPPEP